MGRSSSIRWRRPFASVPVRSMKPRSEPQGARARRRTGVKRAVIALAMLLLLVSLSASYAQQPAAPPAGASAAPAAGASPGAPAPGAPSKIDKGDTAWLLTPSALVLLMTAQ